METKENTIQLNICYNCMHTLEPGDRICPNCGCSTVARSNPENTLPEGTILFRKYLVGRMIGRGGFGVTYVGYDLDLQLKVAIKEYFPAGVSMRSSQSYNVISEVSSTQDHTAFSKGCEAFLDEARMLASVESPYIVHVRDFFREHGTAYIVMNYVEGKTLPKAMQANGGRMDALNLFRLMLPLIEQLDELHEMNIIHRDIKPENIMLVKDRRGEHLVLLDFGAARSFISGNVSKTYTAVVTPGFAPPEQYSQRSRQGAFTDVYGLCATIYYAITGTIPPAATERSIENIPVKPFASYGINVPQSVEAAIIHGLALRSADRTQTMRELYEELTGRSFAGESQPKSMQASARVQQSKQSHGHQTTGLAKRKKKSGGKKTTAILLVLCLAILAGIAGYLFMNRKTPRQPESASVTAEPISTAVIETPEPTLSPVEQTQAPTKTPRPSTNLNSGNVKVGSYVSFGAYEQDNNLTNGEEPIEWLVLAIQEERALLLSRYGLDYRKFNNVLDDSTWSESGLRAWLNESFVSQAFSAQEQKKIIKSSVDADTNPRYPKTVRTSTNDNIFLLSIKEAENYLSEETRCCRPTSYAIGKGATPSKQNNNSYWWLRTPGHLWQNSAVVAPDGEILYAGNSVNTEDVIRPAMWVSLGNSESKAQSGGEKASSTKANETGIKKGSYITFGSFEQDNNLNNGKDPIEWQVLDVKDDSALLISKYGLDRQLFNDYSANVTWETCTLRRWLNGTFLNEAFSAEEQKQILKSWITADKYSEKTADPGNDTIDQVFLLSVTEVEQYLKEKRCQGTEYARARGCYNSTNKWNMGNCLWWTRTPGVSSDRAAYIYDGGGINSEGVSVTFGNLAARPAMWVSLDGIIG